MPDYTTEKLAVRPDFDFEMLFELLQETRLGGQIFEQLTATWNSWRDKLTVQRLDLSDARYLLVYLDQAVEDQIDQVWQKSPSEGFRLNCVAQAMCMSAVYQVLPDVEVAGCAPAPNPSADLAAVLEDLGLPYQEASPGTLVRRFSVLTHFPFRGACEICFLREDCPKAAGKAESFHSVELPGSINPDNPDNPD